MDKIDEIFLALRSSGLAARPSSPAYIQEVSNLQVVHPCRGFPLPELASF